MPQEIVLDGEKVIAWNLDNAEDVRELAEAGQYQCEGITQAGKRCRNWVEDSEQITSARPCVPVGGKRHVCWRHRS